MLTSSLVLNLKNKETLEPGFNSARARSSLSKASMKVTPSSKDKTKTSKKKISDLGMAQLSKSNKELEEKVIASMLSVKKLKNVAKDLKARETAYELIEKEARLSNEDLVKFREKLRWFDELFKELSNLCKNDDDQGIKKLFDGSLEKTAKLRVTRKSLSIEEIMIKPETTRNSIQTSNASLLKSPYTPHIKLLTLSNKRIKKVQKTGKRSQAMTPSIKLQHSDRAAPLAIDIKLHKIITRTRNIISLLKHE